MYLDEGITLSDFLNKLQIWTKDNPGFWDFSFWTLFNIFCFLKAGIKRTKI